MNKLIFQIGLLGFCVAAVVFGGNGGSVIDIVSRSFIVFVGIVLGAMTIVLVSGTIVQKNLRQRDQQEREAENAGVQRNQQ